MPDPYITEKYYLISLINIILLTQHMPNPKIIKKYFLTNPTHAWL